MRRPLAIIIGLLAVTAMSALALAAPSGSDVSDLSGKSTKQLTSEGKQMVSDMESMLAKSFELLQESTKAGDVGAVTSRNDAVTAMKGLVKLSEQNFLTLQQKAAQGDRDRVEHEYVKITIAYAKVQELFAEVRAAGGIQVDLESTRVNRTFQFQGIMPPEPSITTAFGNEPNSVPNEPVHASPYF